MSRKIHKTYTYHGDPRDNREEKDLLYCACCVEVHTFDLKKYLRFLSAIAPKPILT